jgi:hypothetical protein
MNDVLVSGATEGSFISTNLFVKREARGVILHMSVASRLGWLLRKYGNKYPK